MLWIVPPTIGLVGLIVLSVLANRVRRELTPTMVAIDRFGREHHVAVDAAQRRLRERDRRDAPPATLGRLIAPASRRSAQPASDGKIRWTATHRHEPRTRKDHPHSCGRADRLRAPAPARRSPARSALRCASCDECKTRVRGELEQVLHPDFTPTPVRPSSRPRRTDHAVPPGSPKRRTTPRCRRGDYPTEDVTDDGFSGPRSFS